VHNLGHAGFTIAAWTDGSTTPGRWRADIANLGLDLLILQDLGINDGPPCRWRRSRRRHAARDRGRRRHGDRHRPLSAHPGHSRRRYLQPYSTADHLHPNANGGVNQRTADNYLEALSPR
jgi:hypothetical protein